MNLDVSVVNGVVRVEAATYRWSWREADDVVTVTDPGDRVMATGTAQPVVIVKRGDGEWEASPGRPTVQAVDGNTVNVRYDGVNGDGTVVLTWHFDETRFWLSPVTYTTHQAEAIVRVHLFAR